jgi:tRNA threonylcarbamoyladenosine modification (KEOPS) complex  Pcc1 subunit
MQNTSIQFGQNVQFLNVNSFGASSKQWALKGLGTKDHVQIEITATDKSLLRSIVNFYSRLQECTAHQEDQ